MPRTEQEIRADLANFAELRRVWTTERDHCIEMIDHYDRQLFAAQVELAQLLGPTLRPKRPKRKSRRAA